MSEFNLDDLAGEAEITTITPALVEAAIRSQYVFTAYDANIADDKDDIEPLSHVTICVLVLRNGFKVVGTNTGSVDPRNFNQKMAESMARKAATDQIWPLLGYQLKEKLYDR